MRRIVFVLALVTWGCSSPPQTQTQIRPSVKPSDESRRFPQKDRLGMQLVEDRLLSKDFLPGGNLAEYQWKGGRYRQFLVRVGSPEKAAFLLLDFKNVLRDAKFIAHMGGYYGLDGESPVYVFQKGPFLAGFVGLSEKDADPLARHFAARLN